jgi:beta-1,4-mannosyl-glycoprotein beta-1,4-N-acetylglucosaminyltransferase
MIIDSFIFNDELDILEFRLELLWDKVDRFIIVESSKTFTGLDKPFYFNNNKDRFKWAESKIHHYMFSPNIEGLNLTTKPTFYDPNHDCWKVEHQQRNAIMDVAQEFSNSSLLIISDCDEIPSYEALELAKASQLPLACKQDLFYYNLTNLCNQDWRGSIFTTVEEASAITPQLLRDMRNKLPAITDGGWHLSWFGDIKKKLEAQSHQELNTPEFNNQDHINKCLEQRKDLFNRDIDIIEVGPWFFPEYFNQKLKGRFNG